MHLGEELAALVGTALEAPIWSAAAPDEAPGDVQPLSFQSVDDVKAFFKELKRAARQARQGRQLSAAQSLLLSARRWTAPFCPAAPLPAPASLSPVLSAAAALAHDAAEAGGRSSGSGQGCAAAAEHPGRPGAHAEAPLHSHPVGGVADCSDEEGEGNGSNGGEGGQASGGGGGGGCSCAARGSVAVAAVCTTAPACAPSACAGVGEGAAALRVLHCRTQAATPRPAATGVAAAAARPSSAAHEALPPARLLRAVTPSEADSGSGLTSLADSGVPTPVWPPATPRCVSHIGNGGAAACVGFDGGCGGAAIAAGAAQWHDESDSDAGAASPSCRRAAVLGRSALTAGTGGLTGGDSVRDSGGGGVLVVCCCIDLEWWERDSSRVTEIGWTMWDNLSRRLESRHHIVSENEALVNRIHVPDHKHCFLFGSSTTGPLAEGAAALQADLRHYGERVWGAWAAQQQQQREREQREQQVAGQAREEGQGEQGPGSSCCGAGGEARRHGDAAGVAGGGEEGVQELSPPPPMQLVLVGHGMAGDLKALSTLLGVAVPAGAAIVDTADLAWAALGPGTGHERMAISLRLLLKTLGINATKLHNGGNDARYTMEAMLALAAMGSGTCAE